MGGVEGLEFGSGEWFVKAVRGRDHDCKWFVGALFDFSKALDCGRTGGVANQLPAADSLDRKNPVLSEAFGGVLDELFIWGCGGLFVV